MTTFIPGLELCGRYYAELVQPLLERHFPGLRHAAALIGYGSEVLGFDTPMSMDHAWSPRLLLFLSEADAAHAGAIHDMLASQLPTHFLGFPLSIQASADEAGVFVMDEQASPGQINHRVWTMTLRQFVLDELGWDLHEPLQPVDWLTFPAQRLRTLTAGRVYFDNLGELTALRQTLAFYPQQVWLYLLASGWARIAEEEHLMPRAGFVGDELGSALIGSRLARDIMSLCFLMEKQYAPYPKWFGSAFQRLECAAEFSPLLWQAQQAATWPEREKSLGAAYCLLARNHNRLGLTAALPEALSPFHGRPFQVIQAEEFASALSALISDPTLVRIAARGLIGSVDQFSDNTLLRSHAHWRQALKAFYA
jgi:hypothetical protein